jgi:hypothetical protein
MRNFHGIGEVPMTPPAQMQPYEEPHAIPYDVTLTGNQEVLQQGVFIDQDGDFVLKGIVGSQSGAYSLRFRLPSGRYWPNGYVKNTNLVGTAQFPVPVEPNVVFPAGSKIAIDIKDTSGASNTVQILLIGSKLLKTR